MDSLQIQSWFAEKNPGLSSCCTWQVRVPGVHAQRKKVFASEVGLEIDREREREGGARETEILRYSRR